MHTTSFRTSCNWLTFWFSSANGLLALFAPQMHSGTDSTLILLHACSCLVCSLISLLLIGCEGQCDTLRYQRPFFLLLLPNLCHHPLRLILLPPPQAFAFICLSWLTASISQPTFSHSLLYLIASCLSFSSAVVSAIPQLSVSSISPLSFAPHSHSSYLPWLIWHLSIHPFFHVLFPSFASSTQISHLIFSLSLPVLFYLPLSHFFMLYFHLFLVLHPFVVNIQVETKWNWPHRKTEVVNSHWQRQLHSQVRSCFVHLCYVYSLSLLLMSPNGKFLPSWICSFPIQADTGWRQNRISQLPLPFTLMVVVNVVNLSCTSRSGCLTVVQLCPPPVCSLFVCASTCSNHSSQVGKMVERITTGLTPLVGVVTCPGTPWCWNKKGPPGLGLAFKLPKSQSNWTCTGYGHAVETWTNHRPYPPHWWTQMIRCHLLA